MEKNRWVYILSLMLALIVCSKFVQAGGLRTHWGEVAIRNLKIGQPYNIREMNNLPLVIFNTGDEVIDLKIEVLKPEANELKEGFEAIPDVSWVKIGQDLFTVEPNGKASTDVIISIPDDEQYLGKKYQAWIWSHTVGKGMVASGLQSRILLTVASAEEDSSQKGVGDKGLGGNSDFSVLPYETYVQDAKVGRVCEVEDLTGVTLRVVNPNNKEYAYKIESIRVEDSLLKLKEGYEDCPNPSFLIFSELEFVVPAKGTKEIKMHLAFPNEKEYIGKKYMFVIHTKVIKQVRTHGVYSILYVSIE